MDRSREGRRTNMAASNGMSRRRQRSNPLRDSPEEDGQMELQETVRLRDRATKRDRDRDLLNRTKRKRGDRLMQGSSNREDVEESTDESVGRDEEDYEIEDGVSHALLTNTTSTSTSSAFSNQNHRKTLPPAKVVRQAPELKVTDEMIGVAVPRKARSASMKRSHESWVLGNGGCGEEQNHRQPSTSPPVRWSAEALSPSSSNVSVRKKMKPSGGPKTRLPKASKSSGSGQEDIEIEIAEVLYGLKQQSHSSKKEDDSRNSLQNLESKDTIRVNHDTKPSGLAQITPHASNHPASDPLLGAVPKKKKVEVERSSSSGQNGSIALAVKAENDQIAKMETSSPKLVNSSESDLEPNKVSHDIGASKAAPASLELQEEVIKNGDSKPSIEELGCPDVTSIEEKSISPGEESALCGKLGDNFQGSTMTKEISTVSEVESQRDEKFKIDLMAPPPIASSPERDGSGTIDLASDPKPVPQDRAKKNEGLVKNEEMVERLGKKEVAPEEHEDKKRKTTEQKCELLKLDLERLNQDSGSDRSSKLSQKHRPQSKVPIAKVEKTVQSSMVPLPMPIAGWPGGIPHLGYMPSFQTVVPMDGSTGSSAVLQPPHFLLSQPRLKRCATHHFIAHNIRIHQQITKMNHFWSAAAAAGSASICGTKPNNLNVMPAGENVVPGNTLQGSFPVVNLNSAQDKGQAVVNLPGFTRKDKSSEASNFVDMTQKKQLIISQAPQQASVSNLPHGPPFIFPLSQQQTGIAAVVNQSGPSKSATSNNNASMAGSAATRAPANSAALPAVPATVSFNYPNLGANDAPYLTILQSNGYPFQISTPVGTPPTFRGGTPAQALPFFNGSFYSPQMLHPSQLQQQQPHSQPLVQSAYQNTSTSSASSSSHKQPQAQQPRGAQINSNGFLSSASMPPQKHHPSQQSRKLEAEMSGEGTLAVADSRSSHSQKNVYGQTFTVPLQPFNFAMMPSTTASGGGSGNHGEKQQQAQQKSLKGAVELIPSQPFAMSFSSFNGNNTASNLNFSSVAQNPTIFQSLPDMARQGYQVAPAPQSTQQKNHQLSEGKAASSLANPDDGKKAILGKSPVSIGQTLVFDNSTRTLNFAPSPVTGNWPPRSVTSTAMTMSAPMPANLPNSQQQQLLQLHKQHVYQQQLQQQQPTGNRSKASASNSLPASSITAKFPNNGPIYPQTVVQSNISAQAPQWKNSTKLQSSQVSPASITVSTMSTLKNLPQHQGRTSQGHTQISFGGNSKSALTSQGQQIPPASQFPSPLTAGSPSSGNSRTTSTGTKTNSTIPTQQGENSSTGNGQKSSPVCGRNVPSILSTCPSHLSELKY